MPQQFPAPAKVNLFLHITGRRADGYHLLQTVFRLLDYGDTVEIDALPAADILRTSVLPGVAVEDDLCVRAARLLQAHTGCRLGARIGLQKRIPMGGGLGGGSSDAATVLLALNRLWGLDLPRRELMQLGLKLGADVPVFIFGENAWAEGIGEQLSGIPLDQAWYIVLTPAVQVSTAQVFASRELTRDTIPAKMAAFFRGFGRNDLESLVCRDYPAVASALEWLRQYGEARMSGSGASVFAEFDNEDQARRILALKPEAFGGFVAQGLDKHPLHDFAR